jgi:hypothetical protein
VRTAERLGVRGTVASGSCSHDGRMPWHVRSRREGAHDRLGYRDGDPQS